MSEDNINMPSSVAWLMYYLYYLVWVWSGAGPGLSI